MRGLEMLQAFRREKSAWRLSDLARKMKISRSSAFRTAYTLEVAGFIEKNPDGNRYRLTSKALKLGFEYLASLEIVEIARPVLEKLRDETNLSAHLAILDGRDIVHLARIPSHGPLASTVTVGARRPSHATPLGRALLLEKSKAELAAIFGKSKLEAFTEQTPTTLTALEALLKADRARGYIVSHGSFLLGGGSVAAPVHDSSGKIIAAINVSGPTDEIFEKVEAAGRLNDLVVGAADEISARFGFAAGRRMSA
jgi:DNA-binding IclR family transcriptional regulator